MSGDVRAEMVRSNRRQVFTHASGVSVEFSAGAISMRDACRVAERVRLALDLMNLGDRTDFVIRVDKR